MKCAASRISLANAYDRRKCMPTLCKCKLQLEDSRVGLSRRRVVVAEDVRPQLAKLHSIRSDKPHPGS